MTISRTISRTQGASKLTANDIAQTYQRSSFPSGLNAATLIAEIRNSSLGPFLDGFYEGATTVSIAFTVALSAPQLAVLDALVTAHSGLPFALPVGLAVNAAQQSNNTTTDAVALPLAIGLLPAGSYLVTWICEIAPTSNVANTGARVALQSNIGGSFVDHFEHNVPAPSVAGTFWQLFSGSTVMTFAASANPTIQLVWKRLGATSNAALLRRARISLTAVG